jgi:hypothetical protein
MPRASSNSSLSGLLSLFETTSMGGNARVIEAQFLKRVAALGYGIASSEIIPLGYTISLMAN